ncbi:hypothetical protein [Clostridium sp.]
MEKEVKDLEEFNIIRYVDKLKDLRIERLILNGQLNELIIEYNSLKIKNKL